MKKMREPRITMCGLPRLLCAALFIASLGGAWAENGPATSLTPPEPAQEGIAQEHAQKELLAQESAQKLARILAPEPAQEPAQEELLAQESAQKLARILAPEPAQEHAQEELLAQESVHKLAQILAPHPSYNPQRRVLNLGDDASSNPSNDVGHLENTGEEEKEEIEYGDSVAGFDLLPSYSSAPSYADPAMLSAVMKQAEQANFRYPIATTKPPRKVNEDGTESEVGTNEINPYELFPHQFHQLLNIPLHTYENGTIYNPHGHHDRTHTPLISKGYANMKIQGHNTKVRTQTRQDTPQVAYKPKPVFDLSKKDKTTEIPTTTEQTTTETTSPTTTELTTRPTKQPYTRPPTTRIPHGRPTQRTRTQSSSGNRNTFPPYSSPPSRRPVQPLNSNSQNDAVPSHDYDSIPVLTTIKPNESESDLSYDSTPTHFPLPSPDSESDYETSDYDSEYDYETSDYDSEYDYETSDYDSLPPRDSNPIRRPTPPHTFTPPRDSNSPYDSIGDSSKQYHYIHSTHLPFRPPPKPAQTHPHSRPDPPTHTQSRPSIPTNRPKPSVNGPFSRPTLPPSIPPLRYTRRPSEKPTGNTRRPTETPTSFSPTPITPTQTHGIHGETQLNPRPVNETPNKPLGLESTRPVRPQAESLHPFRPEIIVDATRPDQEYSSSQNKPSIKPQKTIAEEPSSNPEQNLETRRKDESLFRPSKLDPFLPPFRPARPQPPPKIVRQSIPNIRPQGVPQQLPPLVKTPPLSLPPPPPPSLPPHNPEVPPPPPLTNPGFLPPPPVRPKTPASPPRLQSPLDNPPPPPQLSAQPPAPLLGSQNNRPVLPPSGFGPPPRQSRPPRPHPGLRPPFRPQGVKGQPEPGFTLPAEAGNLPRRPGPSRGKLSPPRRPVLPQFRPNAPPQQETFGIDDGPARVFNTRPGPSRRPAPPSRTSFLDNFNFFSRSPITRRRGETGTGQLNEFGPKVPSKPIPGRYQLTHGPAPTFAQKVVVLGPFDKPPPGAPVIPVPDSDLTPPPIINKPSLPSIPHLPPVPLSHDNLVPSPQHSSRNTPPPSYLMSLGGAESKVLLPESIHVLPDSPRIPPSVVNNGLPPPPPVFPGTIVSPPPPPHVVESLDSRDPDTNYNYDSTLSDTHETDLIFTENAPSITRRIYAAPTDSDNQTSKPNHSPPSPKKNRKKVGTVVYGQPFEPTNTRTHISDPSQSTLVGASYSVGSTLSNLNRPHVTNNLSTPYRSNFEESLRRQPSRDLPSSHQLPPPLAQPLKQPSPSNSLELIDNVREEDKEAIIAAKIRFPATVDRSGPAGERIIPVPVPMFHPRPNSSPNQRPQIQKRMQLTSSHQPQLKPSMQRKPQPHTLTRRVLPAKSSSNSFWSLLGLGETKPTPTPAPARENPPHSLPHPTRVNRPSFIPPPPPPIRRAIISDLPRPVQITRPHHPVTPPTILTSPMPTTTTTTTPTTTTTTTTSSPSTKNVDLRPVYRHTTTKEPTTTTTNRPTPTPTTPRSRPTTITTTTSTPPVVITGISPRNIHGQFSYDPSPSDSFADQDRGNFKAPVIDESSYEGWKVVGVPPTPAEGLGAPLSPIVSYVRENTPEIIIRPTTEALNREIAKFEELDEPAKTTTEENTEGNRQPAALWDRQDRKDETKRQKQGGVGDVVTGTVRERVAPLRTGHSSLVQFSSKLNIETPGVVKSYWVPPPVLA